MLLLDRTTRFKKDLKLMEKRGKNIEKMKSLILKLANQEPLPARMQDHLLVGQYTGTRECHIEPDWLLIYSLGEDFVRLERTGTHADLF